MNNPEDLCCCRRLFRIVLIPYFIQYVSEKRYSAAVI